MPQFARIRRVLARWVTAAVLSAAAAGPAAAGEPHAVVSDFHSALAGILREGNSLSTQDRYERLRLAIENAFDLRHMVRTAAATSWLNADDATRASLIDAYARISAMTYSEQLSGYSGLTFVIDSVRDGPDDTRLVAARIVSGGGGLPITYVMTRGEDSRNWRVADVLLFNAISEISIRRSEYRALLERGGVRNLTSALNDKADYLLAAP